jgi:hypothetical protein
MKIQLEHLISLQTGCITSPWQRYLARQCQRQAGRPSGKPSRLSQKVFANRPNLAVMHKKFIDIFKWEENDPSAELTPTFSCTINHGIMDDAMNWNDLPACM